MLNRDTVKVWAEVEFGMMRATSSSEKAKGRVIQTPFYD
jgi:hypothetical protein